MTGGVFEAGGLLRASSAAGLEDFLEGVNRAHPWVLSFSFSRSIQDPVLDTWRGNVANVAAAQAVFAERARENGLASLGRADGGVR